MKITYENQTFTADLGNGLEYRYNTNTRIEQTLRKGEVIDFYPYVYGYKMTVEQFIKNCESVIELVPINPPKISKTTQGIFEAMGMLNPNLNAL